MKATEATEIFRRYLPPSLLTQVLAAFQAQQKGRPMTEEEIARQDGRSLNLLLAQQVLGWVPYELEYWVDQLDLPSRKQRGLVWYPPGITPGSAVGWCLDVPHFSTDLTAAWQIVEHLAHLAAHGRVPDQERAAAFAAAFQRLRVYQYAALVAARKICELALLVTTGGKEGGNE